VDRETGDRMHLEHEFVVPAAPEETWQILLDPERVAVCLPGVTLDSVGGDVFAGRWRVRVGTVTATYRGTARLVEKDALEHVLLIDASGKEARGVGTGKASARVEMSPDDGSTRVTVDAEFSVSGRHGELGEEMIVRAGRKILDRFAASLVESIVSPEAEAATAPGSPERLARPEAPADEPAVEQAVEPVPAEVPEQNPTGTGTAAGEAANAPQLVVTTAAKDTAPEPLDLFAVAATTRGRNLVVTALVLVLLMIVWFQRRRVPCGRDEG
jgi:carbon monoxide dehydrogenase subunit G